MYNAFVTQNEIPVSQKCALVRPPLKNSNLDSQDLSCCRPICNLSFVSNILERVIDSRIADHANRHGLFSLFNLRILRNIPPRRLLSKSTAISLVVSTEVKWLLLPYLTGRQHTDTVNYSILSDTFWSYRWGTGVVRVVPLSSYTSVISHPASPLSDAEYRTTRCSALSRAAR